jgi:hypothetical protein
MLQAQTPAPAVAPPPPFIDEIVSDEEWPDEAYTEPELDEAVSYLYGPFRDSQFWV